MRFTIVFAGAVAACLLVGGTGAHAQAGINQPWCGITDGGAEECVYRTQAQCEYDMGPISGDCAPNSRYGRPDASTTMRRSDNEQPATTGTADTTPGINASWCGRTAGNDECVFATQAQCEYDMRPLSGICFPNPNRR